MKNHPVSCETFRTNLEALLAEALPPEEARAMRAHRESCEGCQKTFEEAHDLVSALAALPSPSPRPYIVENLERSIEAERQGTGVGSLWARLQARPACRLPAAAALGLLAAVVSIFAFSQVALSLEGLSRTLLVCALFWACGYTGMFDLAFRGSIDLHGRRGLNLVRWGERISLPVLLALGVATLGLLATVPFGGLLWIFSPFDGFSGLALEPVPYTGWFLLGALIGAVSLLLGVNLGGGNGRRSLLLDGVFAGSLFVLMIAPGFAIICVPFTLGLFFTLSVGLVIGALAGGVLGYWSTKLWQKGSWGT